MVNTDEKRPKICDIDPFNAEHILHDLALDTRRFEYLIERRDKLFDKVRFGLATLNAASLVALVSVIATHDSAKQLLGLTLKIERVSAISFAIGVVFAAAAISIEAEHARVEAARAVQRQRAAVSLAAHLQNFADETRYDEARVAMERYHAAPLTDFNYSWPGIVSQSISIGCWAIGALIPLFNILRSG